MATSLLSLSRELRDLIYVEVLNSELPPPQTEQDIRNGQAELDFCTEEETCVPLSCNLSIRINAVPLLLVNRQIHAEFSDTISLAKKDKRVRYKLDCVVRQESEIYLTWLSVPIPCSYVASLQVDIRHYGDAEKGYSAWWVSGWLGAQITDSLYGLLRRFCRCGPGFYNTQPGGIKVGVLLLNIITPSLHWRRVHASDPEDFVETLGDDTHEYLGSLHPLRALLYEMVGRISIRLDGKERRVFDLVAMENVALGGGEV